MDLSDGLAADLPRLCGPGLGAWVDCDRLPLHPALQGRSDAIDRALRGGDDYQLLLSAAPDAVPSLLAAAAACGVALHPIGHLTPAGPVARSDRRPWPKPAFLHFEGAP
jgi:thiamine-monophosphate kinase